MNDSIIKKLDRIVLYAVIYSTIFITFYVTMPYILPFVLGTIVAVISQPLIRFATVKLKFKRGVAGSLIVLIIFALITLLIVLIVVKIVTELISLSAILPRVYIDLKDNGYKYLDIAISYFHNLDPAIANSIKGSADKIFSGSFTIAIVIVNILLDIIKSLPGILMLILVTLLSSVYIAIDFPRLKEMFFSLFTKEDGSRARNIIFEGNKMVGGYIKAYFTLISISFIETLIGTSILQIRYAVLLSAVTSISDMLPILGPGTVLVPTGLMFIIAGSYFKGLGLIVLFLVILIVRQIIEPKLVSYSLGVYPLAIIAAIFIGLKAYGFIGMIFAIFFVVFYVVLQKVGLL